MLAGIALGFLGLALLAFWSFVPSDNPKSLRSQVQELLKKDAGWRFIVHFALWGLGASLILLLYMAMLFP